MTVVFVVVHTTMKKNTDLFIESYKIENCTWEVGINFSVLNNVLRKVAQILEFLCAKVN